MGTAASIFNLIDAIGPNSTFWQEIQIDRFRLLPFAAVVPWLANNLGSSGLACPSLPCYALKNWRGAMMTDAAEQAMTVRDVAGYLNVDEKTVYRLAKRGELPGFKVAGAWRFKRSDLDCWIDLQKEAAQKNN